MADRDRNEQSQGERRGGGNQQDRSEAQRVRDEGGTVGRGMTSADSTEAPLSAETGEPDDRALGDRTKGRE